MTCPVRGCRTVEHRAQPCQPCAARGYHALGDLTVRYVALSVALPPGRGAPALRHAAPESRPPIRMDTLDTMEGMTRWARTAEQDVTHALDLVPPSWMIRQSVQLVRATHMMRRQWSRITPLSFAGEIADAALRWRDRADVVLGWHRLVHRLPAPCPSCNYLMLVRESGQDHVHCQHCGTSWSEQDYRRLVLVLTSEMTP